MENKIVGFLVAFLFIGMGLYYLFRTSNFIERSIRSGDRSLVRNSGFWAVMKAVIASDQYALSFKIGGVLLLLVGIALLIFLATSR